MEKQVKYLDPKNDLTFRKIFGEHPNIMKSFLNSILPFEPDRYIVELKYADPALLPELPELKHSVVDVRCIDNYNRQFVVEMQMYWTNSFASRMLFNSSKAFVKQIDRGNKYSELHPVYGLSLVDDIFLKEKEYEKKYYHHYRLAHSEIPNEYIKGIELIFIELPKFKASNYTEKKLRNLWLRFLTEIDENTKKIPADLAEEADIKEALEYLEEAAFTKEELNYYEKYWDNIRVERTALHDYYQNGLKIGNEKAKEAEKQKEEAEKQKEEAEKQKEEAEKREKETLIKLVQKMQKYNEPMAVICNEIGLTEQEITNLLKEI